LSGLALLAGRENTAQIASPAMIKPMKLLMVEHLLSEKESEWIALKYLSRDYFATVTATPA
jgi:hypothetical protein